jgi:hypothetical protein
MPALCSVAASAVAAPPVESGRAVRFGPAKWDLAIIAGAGLLVLTLTMVAVGSAWALRAKPANVHETVAMANAEPRLNLEEPPASSFNGVVASQPKASVERIVQPRELVEVMPALVNVGKEEKSNFSAPPADPEIAAKACGGPQQAATTRGTTLEFAGTPSDAFKQAAKEHKLVFLMHISGNFEESGFT